MFRIYLMMLDIRLFILILIYIHIHSKFYYGFISIYIVYYIYFILYSIYCITDFIWETLYIIILYI